MPENADLHAVARVPLVDPDAMLRKLCDHFVEHGTVTFAEGKGTIASPFGVAHLEAGAHELTMRAVCRDEVALAVVKSALAEHVVAFAGDEAPAFTWSGHRPKVAGIPYFREMAVVAARNITPRMRRVTLKGGGDPQRLENGGLHVRILIPPSGRTPVWPRASEDGRVVWPKGEDALVGRVYTVRSIDRDEGTVDVDVVLHGGNHTPGASWAVNARPGDPVGVMGPGGGDVPDADTYLLVGDETALPAIARILERLPDGKRVVVRLEVGDRDDEQPLRSEANLDLRWIYRQKDGAETGRALVHAVRQFPWQRDKDRVFVFAGCEHADARAIRTFLRKDIALPKDRHAVAAYWRRGYDGENAGNDE